MGSSRIWFLFSERTFLPFSRTVNISQRHKTACRVNDERRINGTEERCTFGPVIIPVRCGTLGGTKRLYFRDDTLRACEGGLQGSVRLRLGCWGDTDCFRNKQHAQRGGRKERQWVSQALIGSAVIINSFFLFLWHGVLYATALFTLWWFCISRCQIYYYRSFKAAEIVISGVTWIHWLCCLHMVSKWGCSVFDC